MAKAKRTYRSIPHLQPQSQALWQSSPSFSRTLQQSSKLKEFCQICEEVIHDLQTKTQNQAKRGHKEAFRYAAKKIGPERCSIWASNRNAMELAAMVCLPSPPLYPFISLYLPTPAIACKSVSLPAQIFSNIILQLRSIGGLPNQDLVIFWRPSTWICEHVYYLFEIIWVFFTCLKPESEFQKKFRYFRSSTPEFLVTPYLL